MIDLITGLPGNSKTLFTIAWLKDFAKKENRQVFFHGIPLTEQGKDELGWLELDDPTQWMQVPPNSIVVIDECQKIFRNRSLGAQPGKHVTDLETHRHLGIDLVFITQHPSLIDPAIRRLTGRHRHMVRIWGMEASTVHEWPAVRDNCDKPAMRKDSEKSKWKFDKSIYPLYKSAEVHTVKRTIPMRLKLLLFVPIVIALAVFMVGRLLHKRTTHEGVSGAVQSAQGAVAPQAAKFDPVADAKQFVFKETPRVQGLALTAPKYDEITKPSRVPVPAMCVQSTSHGCHCYSQQGTALDVNLTMCMQFVRDGYFEEFDRERDGDRRNESMQALNNRGQPQPEIAEQVRPAASADGYGVLGKAGPGVRVPGRSSDVQVDVQQAPSQPRVPAGSQWRAS